MSKRNSRAAKDARRTEREDQAGQRREELDRLIHQADDSPMPGDPVEDADPAPADQ